MLSLMSRSKQVQMQASSSSESLWFAPSRHEPWCNCLVETV